jgi:hypothetical protein
MVSDFANQFSNTQPFAHSHARRCHPRRIQLGCLSSGRDGVPDALGVSSTDAGTRRQCAVRRLSKVCKGTACWTPIYVNVQLRNTPVVQQRWLTGRMRRHFRGRSPKHQPVDASVHCTSIDAFCCLAVARRSSCVMWALTRALDTGSQKQQELGGKSARLTAISAVAGCQGSRQGAAL